MSETVTELVDGFANDDTPAVVHNGEEKSYADFYDDIAGMASFLSDGYETDARRVVVLSDDNYALLVGIYSVIYSGGVAVPVDEQLPDDAIERIVDVTEPDLLLTDSATGKFDTEAFPVQTGSSANPLVSPDAVDEEATALILFTSGTTGEKKGVLLSHRNLMRTSQYINEFMSVSEGVTEHVLVPIHHSFGFARTRCVFMKKGTVVLDDGDFNPLLAFKRIANYECTAFSGVPSVMAMLIEAGEQRFTGIGEQIKHVEIGSAPMPLKHKEFLTTQLPNARICMHYGLTEASRSCFIEFNEDEDKLDSVGKPSPGVSVKIVDGEERVSAGETGEITINGPNVAKGYLDKSLADPSDHAIGEWFRSGDVGYRDAEGYVYFEGRNDDIINVGGEKVSPLEIEAAIAETELEPDDYCVVGVDDRDEIYAEVPVLCTTNAEFTDEKLSQLNERLASAGLRTLFLPRDVVRLDEIPRTQNGKELRHQISVP